MSDDNTDREALAKEGYGPEYDAAWDAMTAKPWAWGLAPIHHGCFESGWTGALEAAARLADSDVALAAAIRALAVYENEDDQ